TISRRYAAAWPRASWPGRTRPWAATAERGRGSARMASQESGQMGEPTEEPLEVPAGGKLAGNVVRFGRLLRAAGLPIGTGRVADALRAVERVQLGRRDDLYWALHAALVSDPGHRELFEQAFRLFW